MKSLIASLLVIGLIRATLMASALYKLVNNQPAFNAASIVRIHFAATGAFFCTGTLISPTRVLTAGHCAAATLLELPLIGVVAMPVVVTDSAGHVLDGAAMAIAADPRTDQGMIAGHFEGPYAKVATDPQLNIDLFRGSRHLISCGYPFGAKLFCQRVTNTFKEDFMIGGDSNLYPGMSGGPVFDADTGYIVGINSAVEGEHCLFAIALLVFNNLHVTEQ